MAGPPKKMLDTYLKDPVRNKPHPDDLNQQLQTTPEEDRVGYVTQKHPTLPWTAINTAICRSHIDVLGVLLLCLQSQYLKQVLVSPVWPLHRAALVGNIAAMKLMLNTLKEQCGSDCLRDSLKYLGLGYPVLHWAIIGGSGELIRVIKNFLYQNERPSDWRILVLEDDRDGYTAMNRAVAAAEETDSLLGILLEEMSALDVRSVLVHKSGNNRTPIEEAMKRRNQGAVNFLQAKLSEALAATQLAQECHMQKLDEKVRQSSKEICDIERKLQTPPVQPEDEDSDDD